MKSVEEIMADLGIMEDEFLFFNVYMYDDIERKVPLIQDVEFCTLKYSANKEKAKTLRYHVYGLRYHQYVGLHTIITQWMNKVKCLIVLLADSVGVQRQCNTSWSWYG
jgi:hypothetical protein